MKALVAVLAASSLFAQSNAPLTDSKLMGLAQAGVSETELLRMVATAEKFDFDLRPVSTEAMMKAGISERVIRAMAARLSGDSTPAPATQLAKRTSLRSVTQTPILSKPRIFILHSNDSYSGPSTHPQTVELMKTFGESCPNAVVTSERAKADYVVQFERESLKGVRRHNKFAAFNSDGDMVYSSSTRELGNAVRGFCSSIQVR